MRRSQLFALLLGCSTASGAHAQTTGAGYADAIIIPTTKAAKMIRKKVERVPRHVCFDCCRAVTGWI